MMTMGIDFNAPCATQIEDDVDVPDTRCPLTEQQLLQLKECIDPMQTCCDFGLSLYAATRAYMFIPVAITSDVSCS